MITGIAHNAMKVTDMQKALDFYCGEIGFQKAFELPDKNGNPWIVYLKICDGYFLELFYDGVRERDPAYDSGRIGYHHWCVSAGDLDGLARKAFEKGWIPEPKTGLGRDLNRNLWLHDPDGNALELVQYDPESPQMKSNEAPYAFDGKGFTGIGHVAFTVSDMEKALDFYCDRLGLKLIYSLDDEQGKPWLNYLRVRDGSYLELFYGGREKAAETEQAAGFLHVCLECDELPGTVESLRAKGVPIDVEPKQGGDRNWQAWTHDPDGNKIELMTIDPESPQAKA